MAVLPLPDIGTWLFRRGDAERKRVAAENPVTIVKQLDGHIKALKQANLPHSLKDAEKDALVGAMLLMGKSLQDALNMFMAEVLPHDEYPKGWNEVLSGTLGGLQRALADTLVTLERPHAAETGLSMKQHQESLKTRTLSLELDETPPQIVKPGLNRSESAPAGTTTTTTTTQGGGEISPDFPPLGPPLPLRLAPVPERFEPAYEYRDLAAENPGVSMAVIQELRAEMRVNAAIQLAIESLEFTEGQLQLIKHVNRAAGGADFEPVQQHFYEGYDRILRRAVELERRHVSNEVPVPVSQQPPPRGDNHPNQNRPQTSHTQSSAQLSPTSWKPRPPRRISLVTIPPPHEAEAHSRGGGGGGQRQSSYHQQKRPGTAPNGGMMHRKRSIMFNDDGDFSDYASTLGNSRSYSNLRSSQGSHGSRGSMEAMTMSPTGQAFDQRARANVVRRSTVHGMGGLGIREEDERPQHSRGLSQSQQLDPPTLRRRLSLADELAMASNTDSDSSNYGDEDNNDYYQGDGDGGGGEEEDEEFGEFGEVGEASVIQSELGSGSDRGLASPRSPGVAGAGPGGFVHGMVHGGLIAAAAGNNNNNMNLNDSIHSRGSSLDSIPMSEGLVGQIPPSESGSQLDEGSTYAAWGHGGRGYGGTHSRQVSSVNIDDRISYVPSTWGNVSSVEEGLEEEEEGQQQEEEEEERRGPGRRRLSGYFPGAGRYDGEYDDDREYGDEEEHDMDEEEEEGHGLYADEDAGMGGGGDDHDRSEASMDENEELTEIIEQLRPYMMLGGAASNTGRVSA